MYGVKGRRFIVLFIQHSIRWFTKMSVWSPAYQQRVFQRYHSGKHLSEFYRQDGDESQLALKLRHCALCITVSDSQKRRNSAGRCSSRCSTFSVAAWMCEVTHYCLAVLPADCSTSTFRVYLLRTDWLRTQRTRFWTRNQEPAQTISYGHSCHHLLHKITVLEIDLTIDSYLTAFLE